MSGFMPLELQILSINIFSLMLSGSTLNWSWLQWDRQLEKISNLSVSQSDELDVKNIDWLKSILSWIEVARFIIDRISFLAYAANIYTIVTRRWQNLLILWMVLSFLKDIVLEVIVIITIFLLWYKGSVSTLLLVEFIADKTIWLVVASCKWYTTHKWYLQLRKLAKIREFATIARRSIASVDIPGRVGRSLDDECLDIAIVRRGKYPSLLNLRKLSEELSNRVNFALLKSLVTNDSRESNDTNDYDSNANELSVAEKSMKILRITAEDVMDARARIHERSYWSERDVTAGTPEATEEIVTQFSLEKDEEKTDDSLKENVEQTTKNDTEESVNHTSREENITQYPLIEKEEEKSNNKIVSVQRKEQILTGNQKNDSSIKNGDVTLDEVIKKKEQILTGNQEENSSIKNENIMLDEVNNHVDLTASRNFYAASERRGEEEAKKITRIVSCPSLQSEDARNMEAKPCSSLMQCLLFQNTRNMEAKPCTSFVRKLEAKVCPFLVKQQEKRLDQINWRKHRCQVKKHSMPTDANKKEYCRNPKTSSSTCYRALRTNISKNERYVRSIGINDKSVKYGIDRKEFKRFLPIVNAQKSKVNERGSTFKYSEAYRLKKQIQKSEGFCRKQSATWGSMSLAQTARPSGYAQNIIATNKSSICRRNVQTEICDESNNSLIARYGLKHIEQAQASRRLLDLRSIYNVTSFKNYAKSEEYETTDMIALKGCNDITSLENKKEIKSRRGHDLPANLRLVEREAIEMRALKAYNKLTLLEDKKELETKIKRDSSSNYEWLTKESDMPGMEVLSAYNDLTLLKDKKEMEIRGHNLSKSCKQSIDESSALKVYNELTLSEDKKELQNRKKYDLSKDETPSKCEEDIENALPSVSNHLSEANYEEIAIPSSETRQNANSSFDLSDRYAGQARMSLNLREITRNIEWTVHPRGIILTNKNLHGQFLANGRFRESQERDIVDDNTASMLHSAFFFKPEIVTRVFRRIQTRIGESFPSFPTSWREDLDTEFICRVNNEMVVQEPESSSDFSLERMMEGRNNLRNLLLSGTNDNTITREENSRDLCIIFIDHREQVPTESEIAIIEDSTVVGSQEDARSSIENIQTRNILMLDENHDRTDNDNLSVRFVIDILRNFERMEEYGDVNNVIAHNNLQSQKLSADDMSSDDGNNDERDKISLHENADINETIDEIEQVLSPNKNCSDNTDVTLPYIKSECLNVKSLEDDDSCNSRSEKYLSAINIQSQNSIQYQSENKGYRDNLSLKSTDNDTISQSDNNDNNNNQFDTIINKTEKSIFNRIPENSSKLSFSGPSTFVESNNCCAILRSDVDEELQKLIKLSDSEVTLENQRKDSILDLETTNYDITLQSRNSNVEILKLETTALDRMRNEDEDKDIYKEKNEFSTHRFSEINSDERLQQDDSFYSMYERNDDNMETPVSLEGSLMEEFSNDAVLSETPSDTSARGSAYSQ